MPAIHEKKRNATMAIFKLLDRYLELCPERSIEIAKGLAQHLASTMTLRELYTWRTRIQEDVRRAEEADAA